MYSSQKGEWVVTCVRVQSDSVDENVDDNENIKRPEFDFETAVLKWKKPKYRSMYELKNEIDSFLNIIEKNFKTTGKWMVCGFHTPWKVNLSLKNNYKSDLNFLFVG